MKDEDCPFALSNFRTLFYYLTMPPKHILIILSFLLVLCNDAFAQKATVTKSVYYAKYEKMSKEQYNNWQSQVRKSVPRCRIIITSQSDFDIVEKLINNALQAGEKNIEVVFGKGPFYFKSEHITLRGDSCSDARITLRGNNTIIIPNGRYYRKGEVYQGDFSVKNIYVDSKWQDLNIWGQMYHSDRMVEVLDVNKKLCRVHSPEFNLPATGVGPETYLQLTEWYLSGTYKVTKVEDQYVYFIADDLAPGLSAYGNYNVNYDYTIVKVFPRFRVCNLNDETAGVNVHKGQRVQKDFYESDAYTFLKLYGAYYKSLDVAGFRFFGNAGGGMLLSLLGSGSSEGITVSNCEFRNIKSVAIYMMQTSGVSVTNNSFEDCYSDVILAIDKVKNTIVTDNYFRNVGKGLRSCFAIRCQSSNFYVARNTIVDFGLGGIGVGKGASEGFEAGSGIVEENVLYYTDAHHNWSAANGLIDGGAIYLWTRNDGTTIRYNRIHNYTGAHSNRGIYCDDGAYNLSIYGNVISGVSNNNYIDSRLNQINGFPTNTNNVVMYNIVEGRYKFEGDTKAGNGCVKGQNIVLSRTDDAPYNIVLDYFDKPEEDVFLEYYENKGLKIILPRATRKQLRRLPIYGKIKKYLKVR